MSYSKSLLWFVTGITLLTPLVIVSHAQAGDTANTGKSETLVNIGGEKFKVEAGDVVWSEQDITGQQIYFTTYLKSKLAWSEPVRITEDGNRNGLPVIDEDQSGRKMVVWTAGTGDSYQLRFALNSGKSWSEPATVPLQMKVNLAPSMVIDTAGVSWLVWSANNGDQDEIYFSTYLNGEWSVPKLVNSANEVPDILPELSLGDDGVLEVTWQGYRSDDYVQLQSSWDGDSWTAEEIMDTTTTGNTTTETASKTTTLSTRTAAESGDGETKTVVYGVAVVNMPAFVPNPEQAFLRVYKSAVVKP